MRRLPPLNPLRCFEAAARLGSVRRAAEELFVTPGAVSRQIRALEEALGTPLFRRANRRVEPTAEGRDYLASVADAFDRIEAATDRIARAAGRRRRLAVSAYPSFALRWLVPRWGRFYDLHPEIDIQLATSLAPVDFERDGFDAAVRLGTGAWPGCDALLLCPTETFPVCSPALTAGPRPIRRVEDLAGHTLLHAAPRPPDWQRWLSAARAEGDVTGIDADRGLRFESLNLAYQAAIAGSGVAIGIAALVADELADGRLVRPFRTVRHSRQGFWLVWPSRRGDDRRLRAFRAWLAGEVAAAAAPQNANSLPTAAGATRSP